MVIVSCYWFHITYLSIKKSWLRVRFAHVLPPFIACLPSYSAKRYYCGCLRSFAQIYSNLFFLSTFSKINLLLWHIQTHRMFLKHLMYFV